MTKERLDELKSIISQRTNYYSGIGFSTLANEFKNVENFLAEIEEVIKENEDLKARVQLQEEKAKVDLLERAFAQECEND